MHRESRDIPVAGLMQLPRGTQITILAEANKPLVSVQVDDVADDGDVAPTTHRLELAEEHGAPQTSFQFSVPRLDADKTLLFTLRDSDGIRSREAVRLALGAVADEPPQVNVQLKGIGTAITPQARLPAAGEISDDYGVARVWFDFHVDETPAREQPFAVAANGQEQLAVADALEVGPLELQPKQKLHWAVQAADACALEGGPNVGSSQRYVLDVVTPEQLRAMLEARELTLRRRFETIVEELTDTRNMLAGIEMRPAAATGAPREEAGGRAGRKRAGRRRRRGHEPAASSTASRALQVERVLQNSQRSSHETLQVAVAFDEIREEMINNRVDTEELKTRLKDGVADPLQAHRRDPLLGAGRVAQATGGRTGRSERGRDGPGQSRGRGRRHPGRDAAGAGQNAGAGDVQRSARHAPADHRRARKGERGNEAKAKAKTARPDRVTTAGLRSRSAVRAMARDVGRIRNDANEIAFAVLLLCGMLVPGAGSAGAGRRRPEPGQKTDGACRKGRPRKARAA